IAALRLLAPLPGRVQGRSLPEWILQRLTSGGRMAQATLALVQEIGPALATPAFLRAFVAALQRYVGDQQLPLFFDQVLEALGAAAGQPALLDGLDAMLASGKEGEEERALVVLRYLEPPNLVAERFGHRLAALAMSTHPQVASRAISLSAGLGVY